MRGVVLVLVCSLLLGCGARKSPVEPVTTVKALRAMVPTDLQFNPRPLDDKDNGYLTLI